MAAVLSPEFWFGSPPCSVRSGWEWAWCEFTTNHESFGALLTFVVGLATLLVGWRVARAALDQAETARERHQKQTEADTRQHEADRQRRITESFTKAVELLGDEKLQVRLGGIYTLERISRESELDYWPIMETLTGFVRERVPWKGEDTAPSQEGDPPQRFEVPTDIAAVLTVIRRRNAQSRERDF